jgi:acetyl-CoA carboxylase biotin carboxylase subunit
VFDTVLIANRGEIALRIARTCREMGIRTAAVYSTEDRDSPVTRFADVSVQIGPAPSRRSYMYPPAIIEAARQVGADAIHPGYGFLSEDPDFAEICEDNGFVFIGAPAAILRRMGDKAQARAAMASADMPVLAGSIHTVDAGGAQEVAGALGYPVILKARAGGGGRGMCVVRDPRDLPQAFRETRAGARAAFGDPELYVERFVEQARHIEIQVLCDAHGNAVNLGERDCSLQRRHQKLIEETPAAGADGRVLRHIGDLAVRAARELGYIGLGTFEFLLGQDGQASFIEMNCRVQVEHPVTEMVTGIDLVREQVRVAAGHPLRFCQQDVAPRGAAIECRVNAEDPTRGFAPTPGTIEEFEPPGGPFTRVDGHVYPGARVSAHYDSLLAKVITWAPDRAQAIARMDRALAETRVGGRGVRTTVAFLRDVLRHPLFEDGKHTTGFVEQLLA